LGEHDIGVQNASQRLFSKNPADLDISQAALLAGLIRSPSRFSPFTKPDRARQRRNEEIDAMIAANMTSAADGESAKSEPLGVLPEPLTQGLMPSPAQRSEAPHRSASKARRPGWGHPGLRIWSLLASVESLPTFLIAIISTTTGRKRLVWCRVPPTVHFPASPRWKTRPF